MKQVVIRLTSRPRIHVIASFRGDGLPRRSTGRREETGHAAVPVTAWSVWASPGHVCAHRCTAGLPAAPWPHESEGAQCPPLPVFPWCVCPCTWSPTSPTPGVPMSHLSPHSRAQCSLYHISPSAGCVWSRDARCAPKTQSPVRTSFCGYCPSDKIHRGQVSPCRAFATVVHGKNRRDLCFCL